MPTLLPAILGDKRLVPPAAIQLQSTPKRERGGISCSSFVARTTGSNRRDGRRQSAPPRRAPPHRLPGTPWRPKPRRRYPPISQSGLQDPMDVPLWGHLQSQRYEKSMTSRGSCEMYRHSIWGSVSTAIQRLFDMRPEQQSAAPIGCTHRQGAHTRQSTGGRYQVDDSAIVNQLGFR